MYSTSITSYILFVNICIYDVHMFSLCNVDLENKLIDWLIDIFILIYVLEYQ